MLKTPTAPLKLFGLFDLLISNSFFIFFYFLHLPNQFKKDKIILYKSADAAAASKGDRLIDVSINPKIINFGVVAAIKPKFGISMESKKETTKTRKVLIIKTNGPFSGREIVLKITGAKRSKSVNAKTINKRALESVE